MSARGAMIRKILLAVVSVAISVLLLEGTLRLVAEPPPVWLEPQTKHLRSPLLGWVLPPGSQSYTIDAPVSVNSLGLRDDEIPLEKPAGETRILVLGDSFTFALGVRFDDLYAQILERRLGAEHPDRTFQVINAGVAGYNTRQELIYLRTQGLRLDPDAVVVGFYWNDLVGNEAPLPDLDTTPRIDPDQDVYESGSHAQEHVIPKPIRDALRRSVLLYLGVQGVKAAWALVEPPQDAYTKVQHALLAGDEAALAPYWADTRHRLLEIAETARLSRLPVVLMAFPMELQLTRVIPDRVWADQLREIWEPTGQPFVDLEPAYRAARESGRNPFLPYDLHPNAQGMEIAAEALQLELGRLDLIAGDGAS